MFDELGDIGVGRAQENILGRAALDDASSFEDGDPVADLERLVEIVADENDRLLEVLLQRQQFVLQFVANERIESREWFVHQENVGVGGEGARQADPLLHAARQFVAEFSCPLREADHRELVGDDPVDVRFRHAAQLEPERDVFGDRPPGQQGELLEHHGDPARAQQS